MLKRRLVIVRNGQKHTAQLVGFGLIQKIFLLCSIHCVINNYYFFSLTGHFLTLLHLDPESFRASGRQAWKYWENYTCLRFVEKATGTSMTEPHILLTSTISGFVFLN